MDGSPVPLGSTSTHDPTVATRALWARWKPLDETPEKPRNEGNDHLGTNGLGLERLVSYIHGLEHVAYATPHPRIPGLIGS